MQKLNYARSGIIATAIIIASFILITDSVLSAWGEPVDTAQTSGLFPPLHSGLSQTRRGPLTLGTEGMSEPTLLIPTGYAWVGNNAINLPRGLGVEGKIGAQRYCSSQGSSCLTAAELLAAADSSGASSLPVGSVFMFENACPAGWTSLSAAGGQYYARFSRGVSGQFPNNIGTTDEPRTLVHKHNVDVNPDVRTNSGPLRTHAGGDTPLVAQLLPYSTLIFCAAP
ncbi:MAG: hypothetical protein HYS59_00870 [Candidatus Vogelbacteria bacterium]|nr:hypothetical protein [Candidatus Vogelbacteria bacterium]